MWFDLIGPAFSICIPCHALCWPAAQGRVDGDRHRSVALHTLLPVSQYRPPGSVLVRARRSVRESFQYSRVAFIALQRSVWLPASAPRV